MPALLLHVPLPLTSLVEADFPHIFFSCHRYFSNYTELLAAFRKEFPPLKDPTKASVSVFLDLARESMLRDQRERKKEEKIEKGEGKEKEKKGDEKPDEKKKGDRD